MGCGIGCGAILLLGAIAVVVTTKFVSTQMEEGRTELLQQYTSTYAGFKENAEITDEQKEVLEELNNFCNDENKGFLVSMGVMGALADTIKDNKVDEEEYELLVDIQNFLKEHPEPGFKELGTFMEQHPEIQQKIDELKQQQQQSR